MSSPVSTEWTLLLLSLFNTISSLSGWAWTKTKEVSSAVASVFGPKLYLFFGQLPSPYPASSVVPYASGSAPATWLYDADSKAFHEWSGGKPVATGTPYKASLPILSMELIENETAFYDLTDFLEDMIVYRERTSPAKTTFPTVGQILGAWTLSSGVVVDPARFKARMINSSAETIIIPLMDPRDLGTAAAEPLEEGEIPEQRRSGMEDVE